MAQDPLSQDSMTKNFYLKILSVEQPQKPENTVDTRYVHIRRNCFILYTICKKLREKSPVWKYKSLVIESWTNEFWALELAPIFLNSYLHSITRSNTIFQILFFVYEYSNQWVNMRQKSALKNKLKGEFANSFIGDIWCRFIWTADGGDGIGRFMRFLLAKCYKSLLSLFDCPYL